MIPMWCGEWQSKQTGGMIIGASLSFMSLIWRISMILRGKDALVVWEIPCRGRLKVVPFLPSCCWLVVGWSEGIVGNGIAEMMRMENDQLLGAFALASIWSGWYPGGAWNDMALRSSSLHFSHCRQWCGWIKVFALCGISMYSLSVMSTNGDVSPPYPNIFYIPPDRNTVLQKQTKFCVP